MKKKIFGRRMILVLICLFLIGLCIGYDYAVLTVKEEIRRTDKVLNSVGGKLPESASGELAVRDRELEDSIVISL